IPTSSNPSISCVCCTIFPAKGKEPLMLRHSAHRLPGVAVVAIVVTLVPAAIIVAGGADTSLNRFDIKTLSTDPAHVTGGDVLVQVAVPAGVANESLKVSAAGRDVTQLFKAGVTPHTLVGVVTGLAEGRTLLDVSVKGRSKPEASLEIVNYPITGPVISGPWVQPFVCQTQEFKLPDGSALGPSLDANCSARTVVQYVYRSTSAPQKTEQ